MKCFVVFCNSGYESCKEKISLFKVPKDDEEFKKWVKAIPKRERQLNANSRICSRHFEPEEVIWYSIHGEGKSQIRVKFLRPKLAVGAVPSIFPECIPSCVPRLPRNRKPPQIRDRETCKELQLCRNSMMDSVDSTISEVLKGNKDCRTEIAHSVQG